MCCMFTAHRYRGASRRAALDEWLRNRLVIAGPLTPFLLARPSVIKYAEAETSNELRSSRGSFWWLQGSWASAWWSEEASLLTGSDWEAKHRQQICSSSQLGASAPSWRGPETRPLPCKRNSGSYLQHSACRNQFTAFTFPLEDKKPQQRKLLQPKGEKLEHSDGGSASTRAACAPPAPPPTPPRQQTHLYLFGRVLLFVPDVPRFVVQHLPVVQLLDLVDPDQPVLGCERLLQVLELDVLVADLCIARPVEAGRRPEVQLGTQRRCSSANKQTGSCS